MNGMVSCKNCMAQNSLDSAFCKKCGTTLPADDVQQAKAKLEAAVADGFRIFNAGRTEEAMQVAEVAVRANPSSTAALSLKAMCHERVGQVAEALECNERVLEIDPDSMIDKIKVNDLRNLLVARSSIAAVPDRRMAFMGAAAAFVLVASIGLVIARSGNRSSDRVAQDTPAVVQPQGSNGTHFESSPSSAGSAAPAQGGTGGVQQGNVPAAPKPDAAGPKPHDDGPTDSNKPATDFHPHSVEDSSRGLPNPGPGNAPLIVDPGVLAKATGRETPAENPRTGRTAPPPVGGDPDPKSEGGDQTVTQPKQQAPGIMDIQVVSRNGKPASESSDPNAHPNGIQALLRTARSQYQVGNYSAAATSYERALRAGASASSGNQRLAECYEKLGRNSEAVAAYNRAIDALQADISVGRGDKNRQSAALDVCKQAVKVLGG
ncbi:MAG: tetratricopeptide repeat protein [Fimbriimonadales bacterium]